MRDQLAQQAIEPQQTLGGTAFRFTIGNDDLQVITLRILSAEQGIRGLSAPFTSTVPNEFWFNQRTIAPTRRQGRLPVVKATGRIITQEEIDDALSD